MKECIGRLGTILAVIFVCGLLFQPARADENLGVARLSVLHGNVTIQRGDSGDSVAAALNAPVMVGDYLSTTGDARTEVQFDNVNFVRVGSDAQLRFTRLDPTDHELQLAAGTVELRLLRFNDAHPRIDTPSISILPDEAGSYRVSVTNNGDTILSVRAGRADLHTPVGTQTVESGVSVLVHGPSSHPAISTIATVAFDDFDSWNNERDQYAQTALDSSQYASQDIVGLDDLHQYGHWEWVPDYGRVWVPYDEGADWAPYHDGRWAWEPTYGWTWVGYEPWGWAPYHYGRWFYAPPYGWAWYPGPAYIAPIWQPALVAFFGFGQGFGFSLAFGNIGWVPLAPFEPFYPWWGRGLAYSPTIINNVTNITNITYNITNINNYKNCHRPNALAIVGRHELENGVKYHYLPVDRAALGKVALLKGPVPALPSHGALRFNGETPVKVALSPHFAALPNAKTPVTFEQERGAVQTVMQKSLPIEQRAALRAQPAGSAPTTKTSRPAHSPSINQNPQPLAQKPTAGSGASPTAAWERFASTRGLQPEGAPASARGNALTPAHTRSNSGVIRGLETAAPTARSAVAASPWDRFNGSNSAGFGPKETSHTTPHLRTLGGASNGSSGSASGWDRFNGSNSVSFGLKETSHTTPHLRSLAPFGQSNPAPKQGAAARSSSSWDRFSNSSDGSVRGISSYRDYSSQPTRYREYRSLPSGYHDYRQPVPTYHGSPATYPSYPTGGYPASASSSGGNQGTERPHKREVKPQQH